MAKPKPSGATCAPSGGEADGRTPVHDADRRGDDAAVAEPVFRFPRDLEVTGPGESVGEDRRLQREDGDAAVQGVLHVRRDDESAEGVSG